MGNYCVQNLSFSDTNTAGLKILKELYNQTTSNITINPVSIYLTFGVLSEGLQGHTLKECSNLFKFEDSKIINSDKLRLLNEYNDLKDGQMSHWSNLIWLDKKIELHKVHQILLANKYKFSYERVDFGKDDGIEAARRLNGLVRAKRFNKRIIESAQISEKTKLVACSVCKFKLYWAERFNMSQSFIAMFHLSSTESINVTYMKGLKMVSCLEDDDSQMLYCSIPLSEKGLVMIYAVPLRHNFDPVLRLKMGKVISVMNRCPYRMKITVPKFRISNRVEMKEIFEECGCASVFHRWGGKDFKRMTDQKVYLDNYFLCSQFEVDEEGDEILNKNLHTNLLNGQRLEADFDRVVQVNKPFAFFVGDSVNEIILQAGVVRQPDVSEVRM